MGAKIYTKTGDAGETGRANGTRVKKNSSVIKVNGKIDFASSYMGVARSSISRKLPKDIYGEVYILLEVAQKKLFELGSDVSSGKTDGLVKKEDILFLEEQIDKIEQNLPPLKAFILPGGTKAASYTHLARCAVREAELELIELSENEEVSPNALKYLNRLSDFLFVVARHLNNNGENDILA